MMLWTLSRSQAKITTTKLCFLLRSIESWHSSFTVHSFASTAPSCEYSSHQIPSSQFQRPINRHVVDRELLHRRHGRRRDHVVAPHRRFLSTTFLILFVINVVTNIINNTTTIISIISIIVRSIGSFCRTGQRHQITACLDGTNAHSDIGHTQITFTTTRRTTTTKRWRGVVSSTDR